MQRPTGVVVFGVLEIIFSAITIFTMLLTFIMFGIIATFAKTQLPLEYTLASAIVSLLLGILGLIAGIGILSLRLWARLLLLSLAIAVPIVGLISIIILFVLGDVLSVIFSSFGFVLGLVYYGLILWYFTKPNVKAVFK